MAAVNRNELCIKKCEKLMMLALLFFSPSSSATLAHLSSPSSRELNIPYLLLAGKRILTSSLVHPKVFLVGMLAMVNLRHSWRNSGKTPSQYEVS